MKRKQRGTEPEKKQSVNPETTAKEKEVSKKPRLTMKQRKKRKIRRIAISVIVGLLLVALTITLIVVGINDGWGRENNIYKKNSYSYAGWYASWHRDKVVATLGEYELKNAHLQILYSLQVLEFVNQYGNYLQYAGIDPNKPLSEQTYDKNTGLSWEKHFIQQAIISWVEYCAINTAAKNANFQLPDEFMEHLATLEQTIKESASKDGFGSVDDMLKSDLGENVRFGHYYDYLTMYYGSNLYLNELMEDMEVTYSQINEYFDKNEDTLKQNGVTQKSGDFVDVRHILIMPEGGTKSEDGKTTTYSEEEWEACRAKAQAIYDEWLNGEMTEDSFAALANEKSQDKDGKVTDGGLYKNVSNGKMVEEFNDWCFANMRNPGDHGLIKTDYGYHVMYFVEAEAIWVRYCREGVKNDRIADLIDKYVEKVSWEINFGNIVLDNIELA